MRTVTVVGASLAGMRSAEHLRAQGFDGRLVVVGDEPHLPYDRPPLSKQFLAGTADTASLALGEQADFDDLDAQWHLGVRATGLDTAAGRVALSDGTELSTDGVVVATGGRARTVPGADGLEGVHTVRTIEDTLALRADLSGNPGPVAVVGAGWIGTEVASTCRALGLEVTVVEAAREPMVRALGPRMAGMCTGLHAEHGVTLRCGAGVQEFVSAPSGSGRRVTGLVLADGTRVPAGVVVLGVGMRPAVDWLAGSGLEVGDGLVCDAGLVASAPNVVAVGDAARYRSASGQLVRHEHWTNASEQPGTAVRNLLAGATVAEYRPSRYVWSDQYGCRLQVAGQTEDADEVEVVEGSEESRSFVAAYRRGGTTTGVFAMNNPKVFTRMRRRLLRPAPV